MLAASFRESDALHVEVTVSANPIGYIGGDAHVRKRTPEEIKVGAEEWFEKKPLGKKQQIIQRRTELCPNSNWRFMLVFDAIDQPKSSPAEEREKLFYG